MVPEFAGMIFPSPGHILPTVLLLSERRGLMTKPVLISWIAVNNDPYERVRASRDYRLVDGKPVPGPTLTLLFDEDSPYRGRLDVFD
jgi:hypothetical protein